jgi:hypothetical protein
VRASVAGFRSTSGRSGAGRARGAWGEGWSGRAVRMHAAAARPPASSAIDADAGVGVTYAQSACAKQPTRDGGQMRAVVGGAG